MAEFFATLAWECVDEADHDEVHLLVLTALSAANVTTLHAPLGALAHPSDTAVIVFRLSGDSQLAAVAKNLRQLEIAFIMTKSQVGAVKACSVGVAVPELTRVTG